MRLLLLYSCILVFTAGTALAQQGSSYFVEKDYTLDVPAFLPGIMDDSSAVLNNDTLHYSFKGQLFINAPVTIDELPLPYPYKLIPEMMSAYAKQDKRKLSTLYSASSKAKLNDLLNSDKFDQLADYVNQVATSNIRILAGMKYKGGYMIYTKDDVQGVHENYVVIENGKYKLSSLEDDAPTAWNLGLYFKFEPKRPLQFNFTLPDTLHFNDAKVVTLDVPQPRSWIAIFMGSTGEPVDILLQDNGPNDTNPVEGKISFELKGRQFPVPEMYKCYAICSNYPIQRISPNFFSLASMQQIRIY